MYCIDPLTTAVSMYCMYPGTGTVLVPLVLVLYSIQYSTSQGASDATQVTLLPFHTHIRSKTSSFSHRPFGRQTVEGSSEAPFLD
jgi:hypothetical protein